MIQFDEDKKAVLNAKDMLSTTSKISKYCILCFFNDVIKELEQEGKIKKIKELNSSLGKHNIYELKYKDIILNIFNPGLGAPMAAGFLEELIALGSKNFMACGGAGVLKSEIEMGQLIIPIDAIREEGTSYHYIEANKEIKVKDHIVNAIEKVLITNGIKYMKGRTWTTDAIYRETTKKIQDRKKDGCITVEMEFAGMLAVSIFRNVNFGQILYGGDNLDGKVWEYRNWRENENIQNKMFWLCVEILYYINSLERKSSNNENVKG